MNELLNALNSAAQSPGRLLDAEHGLVMILLLYGLLTTREKKLSRWVLVVILAGILLSIFTPIHEITLFWPVISALVVPPFLWQAAVAVTRSGPMRRQWSVLIWAGTLLLTAASLRFFGGLPLSNALLLSILAVTLVWYFRELGSERSYLSTLGLISLAVLLVEIDIELISPQQWVGSLLSGIGIGFGMGFLGIYVYRRLRRKAGMALFFLAWAYLAYLSGLFFKISPITTTLAAALVVAVYGYSIGLWYRLEDVPVAANTPFFVYLAALVWILLGWQAHTVVDLASIPGILGALAAVTLGIFAMRKFSPISIENRWIRLLRKEAGVLLLLFGAILFWPRQAFLTTLEVEIALLVSLILIVILRETLKPLLTLLGIELGWQQNQKTMKN